MSLISVDLLAKFSGVESDTELAEIYIDSAKQQIVDYVGYDPETAERFAKEIEVQKFFTVYSADGENFFEDAELTKPATLPEGAIPVLVEGNEYQYSIIEIKTVIEVPKVFAHVCLEIATLMQTEEGSNIGVNTSGEAGINRTYLNVVDFQKYLVKLSSFREKGF